MNNFAYIVLIPLLPLISFVWLGLWGRKHFSKSAGAIGTASLLIATIISLYAAWDYFFVAGKQAGIYQQVIPFQFTWLQFTPTLSIDMSMIVDPISVMMLVVISFVSLMVHVFSLWYMKGEERFATYYSFLSLFSFSMLGLVLSGNIFQVYIFWELVGLSSFLLIGFYYSRPAAVAAAKKAFIVTRFADLGFLIGILILAFQADTLDIGTMIANLTTQPSEIIRPEAAGFLGISTLTWGLSLVFMGGAGKSAMFPLHIWLPDAMEGPTPVSALIHAATMVVAGVYLVARLFPLFTFDATALSLVAYVGAVSALLAAVIACTQTDIKRILAYSTMSQIGFMMFALGVSNHTGEGYTASMFHLFTHAFFKSLLFLAAGAIIHFIHSNDISAMGGLRKQLPLVHLVFLTGCLAIAGIPPFAGFFSKEAILAAAFESNKFIYGIALITAALTAFYMFRLYFSVFWKKEPAKPIEQHHGSVMMKIPLIALAVLSVLAGFIPFSQYVSSTGAPLPAHFDIVFALLPITLSVAGIALAAYLYKNENNRAENWAVTWGSLYQSAYRKFYMDEVYLFVTKKIVFNLVARPAAWIDKNIVDGMMNRIAEGTGRTSSKIKVWQSGSVQYYLLYFFGGVIGLALLFLFFI